MESHDEQKKAVEYLSEKEDIDKKLDEIVSRRISDYLSNPNRKLTTNEKELIEKSTKKFNIITIILTALTAVSIGTAATLYSSLIDSRAEIRLGEIQNQIDKKLNQLQGQFDERANSLNIDTERIKAEIEAFLKDNEGEIVKIINKFDDERTKLAMTQGEFKAVNNELNQKLSETRVKITEINDLISRTSETERQLKSITDRLNDNQRLLRILENPSNQLIVKRKNGDNYMIIGELLIQWGTTSTPSSGGVGTISFVQPVNNFEEVSVSITPEYQSVKAFAEVSEITNDGVKFRIYNAEVDREFGRNNAPYSYILIAKIN